MCNDTCVCLNAKLVMVRGETQQGLEEGWVVKSGCCPPLPPPHLLTLCLWSCSWAAHLWCFAALCPGVVLGWNVPVLNLSAALSYLLRASCFTGCHSQVLAAVSPNSAFASLLCGKAKRGHTAASATIGVSVCRLLGESVENNHFWDCTAFKILKLFQPRGQCTEGF